VGAWPANSPRRSSPRNASSHSRPERRTIMTDQRTARGVSDRMAGAISQVAAAGALIVVFVVLSIVAPSFLTADNLFNLGSQTSVNAVMAVGVTLVIITGGIDLSVGSVAALSGVIGVMLMAEYGFDPTLAIIGGILVGAVAGLVNGLLVSVVWLPPFIATLGMLSVARALVLIATG